MPDAFDPYHRWLGISRKNQPPNYYRLLGVDLFEADPEVIRDAAEQRMAHVRTYHLGQYSELSQKVLNELAAARAWLLDTDRKAEYDAGLRLHMEARPEAVAPQAIVPDAVGPSPPSPLPIAAPSESHPPATTIANRPPPNRAKAYSLWIWFVGTGVVLLIVGLVATVSARKGETESGGAPKATDIENANRQAVKPGTALAKHAPLEEAKGPLPGPIVIQTALFGAGGTNADVSDKVRKLLEADPYAPIHANRKALGDPIPGRKKQLHLAYSYAGREDRDIVPANQFTTIPRLQPGEGMPLSTASQEFRVVAARYGGGKTFMDVTGHVAGLVKDPTTPFVLTTQTLGRDPAPWVVKALTVWFDFGGRRFVRVVPPGKCVLIPTRSQ